MRDHRDTGLYIEYGLCRYERSVKDMRDPSRLSCINYFLALPKNNRK